MISVPHLRDAAMRLASTDPPTAQLLQRCGDEIQQQLRVQRDALLQAMPAQPRATATEAPHG